jgi:arsenate reductase
VLGAGASAALFGWLIPDRTKAGERSLDGKVIFACVHNAGRSQMAAAWFNALADPAKRTPPRPARSPATAYPVVVDVMQEAGIDVSGNRPQRLTADLARGGTLLVTMGCGDECPFVPDSPRDWPLADPKDQPVDAVRRT